MEWEKCRNSKRLKSFMSLCLFHGLLRWISSKESTCHTGNPGLTAGLGRSSGRGNGNRFQYSCVGNPMNRGTWWATVHGVTKSQTQLSDQACVHVCSMLKYLWYLKQAIYFQMFLWTYFSWGCGIGVLMLYNNLLNLLSVCFLILPETYLLILLLLFILYFSCQHGK